MNALLCADPEKRITAKEALEHEYFKEIVRALGSSTSSPCWLTDTRMLVPLDRSQSRGTGPSTSLGRSPCRSARRPSRQWRTSSCRGSRARMRRPRPTAPRPMVLVRPTAMGPRRQVTRRVAASTATPTTARPATRAVAAITARLATLRRAAASDSSSNSSSMAAAASWVPRQAARALVDPCGETGALRAGVDQCCRPHHQQQRSDRAGQAAGASGRRVQGRRER
jgi:hypothetical protein